MEPLGPAQSVAPRWGIAAILGLLGVLGFVLTEKISESDTSWTRWERHERADVVLGQSPDRAPEQQEASTRPENDPLEWAKTPARNPQAQRPPRQLEVNSAAPIQSETNTPDDPFAMTGRPAADPFAEASQTPAELDFSASSRSKQSSARKLVAERFQRGQSASAIQQASGVRQAGKIQQTGGTQEIQELAESPFPNPAPIDSIPAAPPEQRTTQLPEVSQLPEVPMGTPIGNPVPTPADPADDEFASPLFGGPEPVNTAPQQTPQQPRALMPQQRANPIPAMPTERQPDSIPLDDVTFPSPTSHQEIQHQPEPDLSLPMAAAGGPKAAPVESIPEPEIAPDDIHKVESGDNYWTISRRYYGTARFFSALAEYNKHRIPEPDKLKPGMYVLCPDVEVLHQRYPQLTGGGPRDPNEDAPPGFFVDENGQPCYRVGKGDTLTGIAQAHLGRASRWVQIQGMNKDRIRDGKTLKIGLVLRLPSDASQVALAPEVAETR